MTSHGSLLIEVCRPRGPSGAGEGDVKLDFPTSGEEWGVGD